MLLIIKIDGKNGFLFKPQNCNDFGSKLKPLINDANLRKAMGNQGKIFVAELNWEQAVKNLLKIWQTEIDRKSHQFIK